MKEEEEVKVKVKEEEEEVIDEGGRDHMLECKEVDLHVSGE